MLGNFSVCSTLLGSWELDFMFNQGSNIAPLKGTVVRFERCKLYLTSLFCYSYIFFQSSCCSSSESTKAPTQETNIKATCSRLCSLLMIITDNITGWPYSNWLVAIVQTSRLYQIFRDFIYYGCAQKIPRCLSKTLNKTKIPQKQETATVKVNINEECLSWVTRISC